MLESQEGTLYVHAVYHEDGGKTCPLSTSFGRLYPTYIHKKTKRKMPTEGAKITVVTNVWDRTISAGQF